MGTRGYFYLFFVSTLINSRRQTYPPRSFPSCGAGRDDHQGLSPVSLWLRRIQRWEMNIHTSSVVMDVVGDGEGNTRGLVHRWAIGISSLPSRQGSRGYPVITNAYTTHPTIVPAYTPIGVRRSEVFSSGPRVWY